MIIDTVHSLTNNLISLISQLGYLGILLGMTIESSFIPFPSEAILIPAGVLIAHGKMNFFLVFFAGVLGSLIGASINYALAFFLGRKTVDFLVDKYGRFLFLNKKNLRATDDYFKKHGEVTTLVGRMIFFVRQMISLPAGFAKMNILKFSAFTILGSAIWTLILIFVGMFFGSATVAPIMKTITGVLLITSLFITLLYYLTWRKKE